MDYVIMMIIGIISLVVILTLLFIGNGSLLHGIKQIIPRADTFFSRSGSTDPASPDYRENLEKADGAFQELVLQYGRLAKDPVSKCFITLDHDAMASIGRTGYTIKLVSSTDASGVVGTNIQLIPTQRSTGEGTAAVSVKENVFIPGVVPCVIYGEQAAQGFYEAWLLDDSTGIAYAGAGYAIPISLQTEITLSKETITLPGGLSKSWQTEGGDYFLLRYGESVCFIPTRHGGARCKESGGTVNNKGLIDDDCFRPDDKTGLPMKLETLPPTPPATVGGVKGRAFLWDGTKCALT